MSAEVKVAIKADNQLRTGLQQALGDVKRFSAEASRSGRVQQGPAQSTAGMRQTLKGLSMDLANASTPGEALESVISRVAGAFGKLTAVLGGFAIGTAIAGAFKGLGETLNKAKVAMDAFNASFDDVVAAPNLDSAISGFKRLGQEIEKVREARNEIKDDPRKMLAAGFMRLVGTDADGALRRAERGMEDAQASALFGSLLAQQRRAEEEAAVAGDPEAEAALKKSRDRDAAREAIDNLISQAATPGRRLLLEKGRDAMEATFAAEDRGDAREAAIKAERDRKTQQVKEDNRPLFAPGDEASANGGWRVQAAEFAKQQAEEKRRRDGMREAQIEDAMESSKMAVGSLDASGLQRIGGASMEFADSRGIVTDLKAHTKLLERIAKGVEKEQNWNLRP